MHPNGYQVSFSLRIAFVSYVFEKGGVSAQLAKKQKLQERFGSRALQNWFVSWGGGKISPPPPYDSIVVYTHVVMHHDV